LRTPDFDPPLTLTLPEGARLIDAGLDSTSRQDLHPEITTARNRVVVHPATFEVGDWATLRLLAANLRVKTGEPPVKLSGHIAGVRDYSLRPEAVPVASEAASRRARSLVRLWVTLIAVLVPLPMVALTVLVVRSARRSQDRLSDTLHELGTGTDALLEQRRELETRLRESQAVAQEREARLIEVQSALARANDALTEMRSALHDKEQQLTAVRAGLQEAQARFEYLRQTLDALGAKLANLPQAVAENVGAALQKMAAEDWRIPPGAEGHGDES